MGLLDQLDSLKDTPDVVEINEEGNIADIEQPAKTEKAEAAPEKEEKKPEPKDEKAEADKIAKEDAELDAKPEVRGYKERKIKAAEAETARERDARIAAEKRLDEALKGINRAPEKAEAKTPEKPAAPSGPPDADKDPDGYVKYMLEQGKSANDAAQELRNELKAIKDERVREGAQKELSDMESAYEKTNPNYRDALKFAEERIIAREKLLNPNVPEGKIKAWFNNQKLELAVRFSSQGKDPVASLYQYVTESWGYQPKAPDPKVGDKGKTLDAVNKNKAKSASPLAGGGENGANVGFSPESAKGMTVAEFADLTDEQKKAVFG